MIEDPKLKALNVAAQGIYNKLTSNGMPPLEAANKAYKMAPIVRREQVFWQRFDHAAVGADQQYIIDNFKKQFGYLPKERQ